MKKLLVYLRPYRLQAILAPCFKLLEAAFELLVPLIMADIICLLYTSDAADE